MMNLGYNIRRLVQLERVAAALACAVVLAGHEPPTGGRSGGWRIGVHREWQ